MIRLHTLGTVDLRGPDGQEIGPVLAQPKRLALLVYLALQGQHGFLRRDHVLALFWPEMDDEHARAALSRAIYFLRQALGDDVLTSRRDAIGLPRGTCWCDAAEFESAASEGRHGQALALYRGDFLEGFHVSDPAEFQQWLDGKRDRLRDLACRSAWCLAEAEESAGSHKLAAQWGRWAAARSPYDEVSVQRLLTLLDCSGDRAGAVREYELFAQRLADELELAPAPETRALIESIRSREDAVRAGAPDGDRNAVGKASATPVSEEPQVVPRGEEGRFRPNPTANASAPPLRPGALLRQRGRLGRNATVVAMASGLAAASLLSAVALRPLPDSGLIVVAPIENRTGYDTLDPLAHTATEWVVRSVAAAIESGPTNPGGRPLRVMERTDGAKDAALFALGERAGTVILGELYRDRGELQFRARVIDVLRRRRVWAIHPITAGPESGEDAIRELSQRAAGAVAALMHPDLAEWFPVATAPPKHDALAEYLRALRGLRGEEAALHFERSVAIDTTFTWALVDAATPGTLLDRSRAHSIVEKLKRKREQLNPLQRAVLSSILATEAGDRQASYEALAVAARLAPEHFLMGYALSAWDLHRPRQALRLLDRVDAQRLHDRVGSTWLMKTHMLHELGDHREELLLTRAAREVMPDNFSALSAQVRALAALGETRAVLALVDTALSVSAGPFGEGGGVMLLAAQELRAHGQVAQSMAMAQRAADWYRNTPADPAKGDPVWHDTRLGHAHYLAGNLDEARLLYEELLEREPRHRVRFYGMLGAIAARKGDRAAAEAYLNALANLDVPTEAELYDVGIARARIAVLLDNPQRALAFLLEGYLGGQGVDLHLELDFEDVLKHDRGFQEFVRPKG